MLDPSVWVCIHFAIVCLRCLYSYLNNTFCMYKDCALSSKYTCTCLHKCLSTHYKRNSLERSWIKFRIKRNAATQNMLRFGEVHPMMIRNVNRQCAWKTERHTKAKPCKVITCIIYVCNIHETHTHDNIVLPVTRAKQEYIKSTLYH